MSDARVALKPSHSGPILALYGVMKDVAYEIGTHPVGPTILELAKLKARAKDFLDLPLIQGLDEDGL